MPPKRTSSSASASKTASTSKPGSTRKPASSATKSAKPASARKPAATRKPASKPASARKPAATRKPGSTRKPAKRRWSGKLSALKKQAYLVLAAVAVLAVVASFAYFEGRQSARGTSSVPRHAGTAAAADLAGTNPVDPRGKPISLTQSAKQAADTQNCTLAVPANPLSAAGLAAPWQLGDGCTESDSGEQAFVEATILAPSGQVTIYEPLVITRGTTPAVTPKPPVVPAGSHVVIDVGFNGANLVLQGAGAAQGRCVDAFGNSVISQTAACGAPAFYAAANAEIADGTLKVPGLGKGKDGKPCETTESFSLVDQDQSDNVDSAYLLNGKGQTARNSAYNRRAMKGAATITNGSDDGLLSHFVDPALGCTPFKAPNTTGGAGSDSSQALENLSALHDQGSPRALLPVNDPQLLVGGKPSLGKVNAYRAETDQPPLPAGTDLAGNAKAYCRAMVNTAPGKLQKDLSSERGFASPDAAMGTNLSTFLGARLSASFGNLGCQRYGLRNPVKLTTNGKGVATAVRYDTARQ